MRSTIVAIEEETTDRRSLTPSTTQRRMTTSRPSQNSRESISRRGWSPGGVNAASILTPSTWKAR